MSNIEGKPTDQPSPTGVPESVSGLPSPEVSGSGLEEVLRGVASDIGKANRLRGYRDLVTQEGQTNGFEGQLYEDALTYELRADAVCTALDAALPCPDSTSWRQVIEQLPEAASPSVAAATAGTPERQDLSQWEWGVQAERQSLEERVMAQW